jgi:hypothetical protein
VQGEIFVCPSQDTFEMPLEGLNGFLGNVPLVVVWGNKLEGHVVLMYLCFEFLRALIVYNVHFGVTPALGRQVTST